MLAGFSNDLAPSESVDLPVIAAVHTPRRLVRRQVLVEDDPRDVLNLHRVNKQCDQALVSNATKR